MPQLIYLDQAKEDLIQIKYYIAKESGNKKLALNYARRIMGKM